MFIGKRIKNTAAIFTILLACIFWYITFGLTSINFWYSMGITAVTLSILAMVFGGKPFAAREITIRAVILGIFSAIILYIILWGGNIIFVQIFNFSPFQVESIYDIRNQENLLLISFILFIITGPAEEIFWRGFILRWLEQNIKKMPALILSSLVYAGVYAFSGNIMLILTSLVAGLFWGVIYIKEGSVVPVIISHTLWTISIFVLFLI